MELTFLTREGCAATQAMLMNAKEALGAMTDPPPMRVVDLDSLAGDDIRRGYPTPTLLVNGADAFGLPRPTPPVPDPT